MNLNKLNVNQEKRPFIVTHSHFMSFVDFEKVNKETEKSNCRIKVQSD